MYSATALYWRAYRRLERRLVPVRAAYRAGLTVNQVNLTREHQLVLEAVRLVNRLAP